MGNKHDRHENYDNTDINVLSDKENEDLFRIAFRNYLDLVAVADRKAGLLIQVNSILAPVVGYTITQISQDSNYVWPIIILLIASAATIFFGILASKPVSKAWEKKLVSDKQEFFFGSFDRLDPNFKSVSWDEYYYDISNFFKGDKKYVFDELIKESYQVRIVLSKKFNYLSSAYKVFFLGLLLSLVGFIVVFIIYYIGKV